jgi:DNA (cytosine-5)-methyltransferase 1
MPALIRSVGATVDAIDLFCGYGGSSDGIHAAGADIRVAANHSDLAVRCHGENFPWVDHRRADLSNPGAADYVDPARLPAARFLWASPSCKYHSLANAQRIYQQGSQASLFDDDESDHVAYANSERSRVTMLCPLRYAAARRPEMVVVENVVEAAQWGPQRRPGSKVGDGSTFRWWLGEWSKLGYEHEVVFLNSMFFPPCPQSRDRMYIALWRRGNRRPRLDYRPKALCCSDSCGGRMVEARQSWKRRTAAWPLERWGRYRAQYLYRCPDCRAPVEPVAWPAYSAIDWTNLGPRIADRSTVGLGPLAPDTLARIRRGLTRFRHGPPLVIPAKSIWGTDRPVTEPLTTQTTQQDKGLVTNGCVVVVAGNTFERPGAVRARDLSDSLYTLHTTQAFGFAHLPFITELRGGGSKQAGQRAVTDSLATIVANGSHHGLTTPALFAKFNGGPTDTAWHPPADPLGTITARDTTGLVVLPWIDQWRSDPAAITEQLATIVTHTRHSLAAAPEHLSEPITDDELAQVRYRMLEPDPELRRGMAVRDDYILLGNKTEMTAGLGNMVTPPVATWITEQCLATLRGTDMPAASEQRARHPISDADHSPRTRLARAAQDAPPSAGAVSPPLWPSSGPSAGLNH